MHWIEESTNASSTSLAQAVVAHAYEVRIEELKAATRGAPRIAWARQVAMYLSHTVFGMSITEVAAAFMRHPTTTLHALRHVEDRRSNPEIDRTLSVLEHLLTHQTGGSA
jgi:chromosomal replication initiation ATPase DnaA